MRIYFLFCFSLIVCLGPKLSLAQPEWDHSGEFAMHSIYYIKPSSMKNQFAFKMPEARLNLYATMDSQTHLQLGVVYAKSRNPSGELWSLQVEETFIEFGDVITEGDFIQYGLVPSSWLQLADEYWPYRLSSQYGATLTERFSYVNRSDLGVKWGGFLGDDIELELALVNGEGGRQDESGSKKELQSLLRGAVGSKFQWAIGGIWGNYENIDAEIAKKERLQLLINYDFYDSLSLFVEALLGQDAVDAINKTIADKVDLTTEGGKLIKSQGASAGIRYSWQEKKEFFLKADYLNPAVGVDAKGLRQILLGFGFFPRQYLQFSIAWGDVKYENNYASYVRDGSELVFSTQLKW
jgi:hypothetical protein